MAKQEMEYERNSIISSDRGLEQWVFIAPPAAPVVIA